MSHTCSDVRMPKNRSLPSPDLEAGAESIQPGNKVQSAWLHALVYESKSERADMSGLVCHLNGVVPPVAGHQLIYWRTRGPHPDAAQNWISNTKTQLGRNSSSLLSLAIR